MFALGGNSIPGSSKDVSSLDGPIEAGSGTDITFSGEAEEETCLEEFWKERHWVDEGEELSTAPPLGFGNGNGGLGYAFV